MCFRKNKEIESIDDYAIMFKHRNFHILDDRIEYTEKIANLLNRLVLNAIEYGKNINNNDIIESPNGYKVPAVDLARYNLMLSMVNCQMEDTDGLFSFCTIRGLKPGENPQFEFKDRKDFFI